MIAGDPITAGLNVLDTIISKVFPDPKDAAEARAMILSAEFAPLLAQLKVNEVQAASGSMFVAGGRPFIMWICGAALGMQFVVAPLLQWASLWAFNQGYLTKMPPMFPGLDNMLWELMFGMLGLGALRSFDKRGGVATDAIAKVTKK
jgi:hypothetical protein